MFPPFFIFLVLVNVSAQLNTLWPEPTGSIFKGTSSFYLADDLKLFILCKDSQDIIKQAANRYMNLIKWYNGGAINIDHVPKVNVIHQIHLCAHTDKDSIQLGFNENYSLNVTAPTSLITSTTVYGIIRGLETFSQLVELNRFSTDYNYVIHGTPIHLSDSPRFQWRGLLIDTSRHYLKTETIKRTLDALSYNKFNTLHWHMTDAESFPFDSKRYPEFAKKSAYGPDALYTYEDVKEIVSYAKNRGIRVVPEIDIPGHSASFGKAYPIVTNCPDIAVGRYGIDKLNLSPASADTIPLLKGLFKELVSLFPDSFFHVGGDEVSFACWNADPDVLNWMIARNISAALDVYSYFVDNAIDILKNLDRTSVFWQEVFDRLPSHPFPHEYTVIEVWKEGNDVLDVVKEGYKAILAGGNYLDAQVPSQPQHWRFGDTWQNFFLNDPCRGVPDNLQSLVLGGEAAMWSEQVVDEVIDTKVWPRAGGTGYRLWSLATSNDTIDAARRLNIHSCRLRRRGISSFPIDPDYCIMPLPFIPTPIKPSGTSMKKTDYFFYGVLAAFAVSGVSFYIFYRTRMRSDGTAEQNPLI